MGSVLIIGAGAAGSVATQKCAMNRDVFTGIHLASRTLAKCEAVARACATPITISQAARLNPTRPGLHHQPLRTAAGGVR